jgi:hypothetical protein
MNGLQQVNREPKSRMRRGIVAGVGLMAALMMIGCSQPRVAPQHVSPWRPGMTLAVAPFRNLSGISEIDVMAVTDEFYTELQQVSGLEVMPVNRVLATLQELNLENVGNPEEVQALALSLGVDGVIVGSVTRYNPYPPPEIGMVVQLYLREAPESGQSMNYVNPGELARAGRPFQIGSSRIMRPSVMAVRIFDSRQKDVQMRIEQYVRGRAETNAPYGWKWYTTRRNYLRFVSYEMIGELLAQSERQPPRKETRNDTPKGNIAGEGK